MNKTVLLRWWELIGVGVLCSILGSTILFIALYIFHNTNDANNVAVASCFFTSVTAIVAFLAYLFSRKTFHKERFDATFFSLLNQRWAIIDNFYLYYNVWDYTEHESASAKGERADCFKVAYTEIALIRKVLFKSASYLGMENLDSTVTQVSVEQELKRIHDELNDDSEEIRKMDDEFYARLINRAYQITLNCYQREQQNKGNEECELRVSFGVFLKGNGWFLEHYLRHLKQILVFVNKDTLDKSYYIEFLESQMTRHEMWIVYCYALTNDDYYTLLNKLGMIDYIKNLHKL
ncbi:MAG: putative phage abortive infection protein [Segatella copri]|nr:putative phage abortive infection protein [Segatella copri]